MTTVATDGITIASDGLVVSSGEVICRDSVKVECTELAAYCGAGTLSMLPVAILWVKRGAHVEHAPPGGEHGWTVWKVTRDGIEEYSSTEPNPIWYNHPHALGSGSSYARVAMRLGRTPKEAVEIASEFDIYTGGNIVELHLP